MRGITFVFSLLLIATGILGGYLGRDTVSMTGLIPAYFGLGLLLCALASLKRNWRMHVMHAAATIALLGIVLGIVPVIIRWGEMSGRALTTAGTMVLLLILYLILCIRSFIQARRQRSAATAG